MMKIQTSRFPHRRCLLPSMVASGIVLWAVSMPTAGLAQIDDFDDGNDEGWTHYSPLSGFGVPGRFSFPDGRYRIRTTTVSPNPDTLGPGRAGSIRAEVYSDFYVAVDVVDWDHNLPQAFGILARIETPGLGMTTGYAFTWDRGTTKTSGDVDISRITGEDPSGVSVTGEDDIHLKPGRPYRFVFIGQGGSLEGRVYELPDTRVPLVSITGFDMTYSQGRLGLVVYDNSSGGNMTTDATFDNFFATAEEPPLLRVHELFGEVFVSWPRRHTGFTLQCRTNFGSPRVWMDIDPFFIIENQDEFFYSTYAPAEPLQNMYYRLKK